MMFHLFKLSSSPFKRSLPVSLRSLKENNHLSASEKTCILCKNLNINSRIQLRNQSSLTNPSVNKTQKRRRKKEVFTDVLEVTDETSRLRKANVTKLTPSDMNLLAATDVKLNELYKLKELTTKNIHEAIYTYSNLVIEGIPRSDNELKIPEDIFKSRSDDISLKSEGSKSDTEQSSKFDEDVVNTVPNNGQENKIMYTNPTTSIIDHKPKVRKHRANIVKSDNLVANSKSAKDLIDFIDQETYKNSISKENHAEIEYGINKNLEFKSLTLKTSFHPEVEEAEHEYGDQEDLKPSEQNKPQKTLVNYEHKNEVAAKTLASYIEVCNHLKNPQRGLQALYFHQSWGRKSAPNQILSMKDIKVYSALLKGYAHKGDYKQLLHVLSIMEEEQIEPNLQCYVSIFECLGKINVQDHYLKDIRIFAKEALRKNITFDRIMNEGVFLENERSYVFKALQAYDETYIPKYEKPKICYDNHLLTHLNNWEEYDCNGRDVQEKRGLFTPEELMENVKKQMKFEESGYVTIKNIDANVSTTDELLYYRKTLENHYKMWATSAEVAFQRDLASLSAKRSALNMEPYMRCIPMKEFVNIIVQEAKRFALGSETYSPEVYLLYRQLGLRVYSTFRIYQKKRTGVLEKMSQIHSEYCKGYAALHDELDVLPNTELFTNPRIQWQLMEHSRNSEGATLNMDHQPWVPGTLTAIGKFLYHIIMHDLKVDVNCMRSTNKHKNLLPAFYTIFRTQGRIVKEEVKPHPILSKLYKASQPETLTFPANEVPMVCPPVPWTTITNGGYISIPTDIVRLPYQATTQLQRMAESDMEQLYPSFDALNQLASVPWTVNEKVLDVILEVFRNGGSSKLDVPEQPSSLPPPPSATSNMDRTEKYEIYKQKLQHKRKKAEMYSLWCDCLYRLSLANHFRNDVFWLPHNMDFRGRVYPVPPHLNHLGSDLARSMLIFAEARPLGPDGLDWLKIHLINLTGLKKRDSIQDRLNFANDIIDLILDSADKPLTGQKWWAESDEPWQTLACCMEVADVIRSGIDPSEYRSRFPVHQDGSCNGLQHYAALGRDSAGAHSVNLTPSEIPQDVYSAVVALVEEQRAQDEANGIEIAKVLNGFVKRKVIKQTIMTTVYGVTRYGARLQITKQLKDIDDFPKESVWAASAYLTARTFESLRTMFTSTREIQDWFTECARLISGVSGELVEWVTPLGFPIVQPYVKIRSVSKSSAYDSFPMDKFEKPNVMKQKNAFPPNFVHSLDSCHMMLTSLHCERAGITFVSVHDCYWTHPSTIHIMNRICREQFVALHSEPILENLSLFLYEKYAYDESDLVGDDSVCEYSKKKLNRTLRQLPRTGQFDIKNVLNSLYFFS